MTLEAYDTFDSMKARLDEIVDEVNADGIPLDDALALYEEAVALGLRASDLLEEDSALSGVEDVALAQEMERSATTTGSDGSDAAVSTALDAAADGTADAAVPV